MLASILTVERNDLVTLNKSETTHRKGDEKAGIDYALPFSRMFWNCLEDSREFYSLAVDIKAILIIEIDEIFFLFFFFLKEYS